MEKIKKSSMTYRVPYADTDQMGVVYYANYLEYFERVRAEFLRDVGYTYGEFEADGFMLPVAEAHCNYKKPAHFDDLLELRAWCSEMTKVKLVMSCEVVRDGEVLAEGYTVHPVMNAETRRIAKVPAKLKEKFEAWINQ